MPAWIQAKITLASDYISTVGNYLVSKNEKVNEDLTTNKNVGSTSSRSKTSQSPTLKRKSQLDQSAAHYAIQSPAGSMKHNTNESSLGDDFLKMLKDKGIKHRVHGTPEQEKQRTVDKLAANKAKSDVAPKTSKTDNQGGFGTHRGYGQGRYMGDSVELEGEMIDEAKSAAVRLSAAWNREKVKSSASIQRGKEMMDKIKQDVKAKSEKPPIKEDRMKSVRIIKDLYKKKNMKEEMYDHEKDDKGSQSLYGKPPKVGKSKEEGESTNKAAAVLKGGTTLTGQGRDTIEIDPMMRTRPTNGASPEDARSKKSIG